MNKTARHSLLIAGLASCAFGTQAFADNEAYTLGQIEVAGSRQADVAEKSTTVWRISAEDIERRGARTLDDCLLYTSPSPRDRQKSRMPSSA